MSTQIQTAFGEALPPQPHHSITVHLPKWTSIVRFAEKDAAFMASLKSMYPRMVVHPDIKIASTSLYNACTSLECFHIMQN